MSGSELYRTISHQLGSDKAASEYLHSLGIRGIKYLDNPSRGAGEGTYNYVMFNPAEGAIITHESGQRIPGAVEEAYRKLRDPKSKAILLERYPELKDLDKPLVNSQGNEIKNPEKFKNWFGESKVVDAEGKPLVVYHGTGTTIEAFDPSFTGKGNDQLGSGFYFTTDSDQAKGYETHTLPFSNVGKLGGNDNPNTVSAYVSIKKPILLSADQDNLRDVVITQRQAAEIIKRAPNIYDADESPLVNWIDNNGKNFTPNQVDKIAKEYDNPLALENDFFRDSPTEFRKALHDATGHDGIIKEFPDGSKHVVSWFPNQIKSVNNRGTFDPNNPNILMGAAPLALTGLLGKYDKNDEKEEQDKDVKTPLAQKKTKGYASGGMVKEYNPKEIDEIANQVREGIYG